MLIRQLLLSSNNILIHKSYPPISRLLRVSFNTKKSYEELKSCSTASKDAGKTSQLVNGTTDVAINEDDDDMENMFIIGPGPKKEIEWGWLIINNFILLLFNNLFFIARGPTRGGGTFCLLWLKEMS